MRVFDRKKDMINRGGYKIYSIEVENVLMATPTSSRRRSSPGPARCSASAPTPSSCAEARRRHERGAGAPLRPALADYKVPDSFSFRPDPLPRNANGKVIKRQLRDELLSDQLQSPKSPCGCIIASC